MSSSDDFTAQDAIDEGSEGVQEQGVSGYARASVIGAALSALAFAIADFILSVQQTLFAPIRAFVDGMATLITGTLGGPLVINEAGAQASAQSFLSGVGAALGPFAFPLAVIVSTSGIFLFIYFLSNTSINPLTVWRDEDE